MRWTKRGAIFTMRQTLDEPAELPILSEGQDYPLLPGKIDFIARCVLKTLYRTLSETPREDSPRLAGISLTYLARDDGSEPDEPTPLKVRMIFEEPESGES